jgi:hypothetical protein
MTERLDRITHALDVPLLDLLGGVLEVAVVLERPAVGGFEGEGFELGALETMTKLSFDRGVVIGSVLSIEGVQLFAAEDGVVKLDPSVTDRRAAGV